ncbi:GNAT family N-acetyltransferase [Demequina soli]|uniref:GNAT family N-acetyltransferase n=1 Tax=Demequina soli TaxID=1638987 RepID=UPI00078115B7|nr:GNAT family N-acetyltransferase [Demequina soli]
MDCSLEAPTAAEFRALYLSTGWGAPTEEQCARALAGSWAVSSARDASGALVGVGRLISDGAMHAYVNEMIVREDARGAGVGAEILRLLVEAARAAGVTQVQLFAARGRAPFYARHGFIARPDDAPGMEIPQAP